MQLLEHYTIHGWPPTKKHLPIQLQPFWNYRDERSVADGLLKSTRAIVSISLRPNMLNIIRQSQRPRVLRFARDAILAKHVQRNWKHLPFGFNMCQIWKTSHRKTNAMSPNSDKALAICFPGHLSAWTKAIPNHSWPQKRLQRTAWALKHTSSQRG